MKTKSAPSKRPSRRVMLPRILNLLLWLSFSAMSGTGLLLAFRLPPGSQGGRGLTALGLDRHEWGDYHTWISYVFIAAILLHLALHWRWLWQVAARKRSWPMWLGIGSGILLILLLIFQPIDRQFDGKYSPTNDQHNK
ncbi:MAG: DUF4405 domain-containing protein [Verrucomicrobia bacterium]|jgi:hypothetical protein|nr:DUF4405 domain-containing protein [Verrucomicrobiota bacterium]